MKNDPYTLVVCLDRNGKAEGTLYLDDEKSFEYRNGKYVYVNFKFDGSTLTNHFVQAPNYDSQSWIERVVIAGLEREPKSATITVDGVKNTLDILAHAKGYAVRKPGVSILKDFEIKLNY